MKRLVTRFIFVLVLVAGFPLAVWAVDADLDPSFNGNGFLWSHADAFTDPIAGQSQVLQQADGKLILVGRGYPSSNGVAIVRHNADGSVDGSFNNVVDGSTQFSKALLQADGKIVIAGTRSSLYQVGTSWYRHYDCVLSRYNSDGTVDISLNETGTFQFALTKPDGSMDDCIRPSLIQNADGKLVISASDNQSGWGDHIALRRYNLDGSLDTTFNSSGVLEFAQLGTAHAIGTQPGDQDSSLIQQKDGKLLLLAGAYFQDMGYISVVLRLNPDGSRDDSFNGNGMVPIPSTILMPGAQPAQTPMVQQRDGKIIIAGSRYMVGSTNSFDASVVRLNSDGSLDTGFNGSGDVRVHYADTTSVRFPSLIPFEDGKLMVGVNVCPAGLYCRYGLFRLNSDGVLDSTFAATGVKTLDAGYKIPCCTQKIQPTFSSMIRQADGKLVLVGYDSTSTGLGINIARFLLTKVVLVDGDGDGVADDADNCPILFNANQQDTDGDGIGDVCDSTPNGDIDGDGVDNLADNCPRNMNGNQLDTDKDGIGDVCDSTPNGDVDGDGIDNLADSDNDNDGVPDISDAFPFDAKESVDSDHDGIGDNADPDDDNDGVWETSKALYSTSFGFNSAPEWSGNWTTNFNSASAHTPPRVAETNCFFFNCSGTLTLKFNVPVRAIISYWSREVTSPSSSADQLQFTINNRYTGFHRPPVDSWVQRSFEVEAGLNTFVWQTSSGKYDLDDVTITAIASDNCPLVANPDQLDTDGDGLGNVCDPTPNGDTDNDGVDNLSDNCPVVANTDQADTDGDGLGNACDSTPNGDTDNDGVDNLSDNCPAIANADQADTDSDGTGDACDSTPNGDSDGDGIDNLSDILPNNPYNCSKQGFFYAKANNEKKEFLRICARAAGKEEYEIKIDKKKLKH